MNENDAIEIIRNFIYRQFPKECTCCERSYNSFTEFILNTEYVGNPMSHDADIGAWQPERPLGTIGMVRCSCGTTLSLSSKGMDLKTLRKLMSWVWKEAKKRGISTTDILEDLRSKIDKSVRQDESKKIENWNCKRLNHPFHLTAFHRRWRPRCRYLQQYKVEDTPNLLGYYWYICTPKKIKRHLSLRRATCHSWYPFRSNKSWLHTPYRTLYFK